ncbi:MAG: hypothetical protein ABIV11_04625 [Gemmatimonadaceae bacterium]
MEQGLGTTLLLWRRKSMRAGDMPCALGQPVRAQHFPSNRTDQLLGSVTAETVNQLRQETSSEFWREYWGQN